MKQWVTAFGVRATHLVFRPEAIKRRFLRKHCAWVERRRILEIGSGKAVNGQYIYSVRDFFTADGKNNTFECSDLDPDYGHRVIDIRDMEVADEYDVIVCLNVLEHVYEWDAAIANLHRALRSGGTLFVLVPALYPLHDEPHDYWRFTEHALRKMFARFDDVDVDHAGPRQLPTTQFVVARRA
jgi:SAM-dependent methyltransferase